MMNKVIEPPPDREKLAPAHWRHLTYQVLAGECNVQLNTQQLLRDHQAAVQFRPSLYF